MTRVAGVSQRKPGPFTRVLLWIGRRETTKLTGRKTTTEPIGRRRPTRTHRAC